MGAAGSPDVANIYGMVYENQWISQYQNSDDILFYGRYLDDIFTLVVAETPDEAAAKVNFIKLGDVRLLWEEPALTANFLDLHLEVKNGKIIHEPFVKSASHRERIPWDSGHPIDVKKGTFASEISRLATLCSEYDTYTHQCSEAVNLYIGRGYPPKLITSWLKDQKQKRWEDRLTKNKSQYDGSILFTLKTHFNEAWKFVNVHELERTIKSVWSQNEGPTVLGKRKGQSSTGIRKRVKLTGDVSQTANSSTLKLGHELDADDLTATWIDKGKFLVSRKRNKQLWDVTRTWNKSIYAKLLEEIGSNPPEYPMHIQEINEFEIEH